MATLSKNDRGEYFAQWYDSARTPKRKRVYLKAEDGSAITRQRDAFPLYRAACNAFDRGEWCPWRGDLGPSADDGVRPDVPVSLDRALSEFLNYKSLTVSESTVKDYSYLLNALFNEVGRGRLVHELEPIEVMEWAAGLDISVRSRKDYIDRVAVFLRWAQANGHVAGNPSEGLSAPRVPEQSLRDRFIHPPDFKRLVAYVETRGEEFHQWLVPVMHFGVNTGLRNSEIRETTWNDIAIGMDDPFVVVPAYRSKNGKERRVPLNGPAFDAVREVRNRVLDRGTYRPDDFVFVNRDGQLTRDHVSKTFKRYVRDSSVPDRFHFHCLRHTFCSMLAQNGVSAITIKTLAGHASISTSEKYIHAFYKHSAAEATKALNSVWS